MYFAINNLGKKSKPVKTGERGTCLCCGNEVISKCGMFKVHHWAHKSKQDCDSWHKPMSKWHENWQAFFPDEWKEVLIKENADKHIADIRRPDGKVIEFQHSLISPYDIVRREEFYKDMVWVFDDRLFNSKVVKKEYNLGYIDRQVWKPYWEYLIKRRNIELRYEYIDDYLEEYYDVEVIMHDEGDIMLWVNTKYNNNLGRLSYWCEHWSKNRVSYSFKPKIKRKFLSFIKKPLFIDGINGCEGFLLWVQKKKLISKDAFIQRFLRPTKDAKA